MLTQTALLVTSIGHPVISTTTHPIPRPGPGQIQLRITVAGLNPHDQKGRDAGLFIKDSLPAVLGDDIVGIVTELGQDATRFTVGQRVFGQGASGPGSTSKALQEYAVLDERFAAPVPEGVGDGEVAGVPVNAMAGVIALFSPKNLALPSPWAEPPIPKPTSPILIIGGGSNCGRFGTQLARLAGFRTVVVVGGDADELMSFGATHVLSRHGGYEAVGARIREVVGDELEYVFDAVSVPADQHLGINALSRTKKGTLARLLWSRGAVREDLVEVKEKGYALTDVLGLSSLAPEVAAGFWSVAEEMLESGELRTLGFEMADGLDAEKVNGVLDRYRDGEKVVQTHFRISE